MRIHELVARGRPVVIVAVVVCASMYWPAGQADASELVAAPQSCLVEASATVTFSGSGLLGMRTGHEHGRGTYFACRLADPSIHYGTATFDSDFTLDCLTLQFTDVGAYTIRWDNGRTTQISYSVRTGVPPPLALAEGYVTSGQFKGQQTVDYNILAPLSPNICTETSGSLTVVGVGLLTIGSPPLL